MRRSAPCQTAATFRYDAAALAKLCGEIARAADTLLVPVHREPAGAVGAIVPSGFPLMIGSRKPALALAAGTSVDLKPAGGPALRSGPACRRRGRDPRAGQQMSIGANYPVISTT